LIDKVNELLIGACDLHIHGGPDVVPRRQDIIQIAEEAKSAGMSAVVFKDHNTCTADRAYVASKVVSGISIFGGLVLNHSVGGFNAHAVDMAIKLGARVIWMPSVDASYTIQKVVVESETPWLKQAVWLSRPEQGLSIFKKGGEANEIAPEIKEILYLIREADIILDTCHLSPKETFILVKEAKNIGLSKIAVSHPNCSVNRMSISEQKELAEMGAYFTYAFLPCMPMIDGQKPTEIAKMITEVGPKHSILITDFGQLQNPTVVEGMRMYITHMLLAGLKESDIKLMINENPSKLLNT